MKFCVCSSLLSDEALHVLRESFPVILLPPDNDLPEPIRCHPDSIFTVIGRDLILSASYAAAHPETVHAIASCGQFRIVLSDARREPVYPHDAGLNAAVGRNFVICRPESAAPEILQSAGHCGYSLIPVRQGYAGCACLVTDDAVLTGDPGISRVLASHGIHGFLLSNEGIRLPGYRSGFIGGACGFSDGIIYVNGNPIQLPCYPTLRAFADSSGYSIRSLTSDCVTDVGGIRFFDSP